MVLRDYSILIVPHIHHPKYRYVTSGIPILTTNHIGKLVVIMLVQVITLMATCLNLTSLTDKQLDTI
jgi:hypothetical protein